jgi:hypothetical protein
MVENTNGCPCMRNATGLSCLAPSITSDDIFIDVRSVPTIEIIDWRQIYGTQSDLMQVAFERREIVKEINGSTLPQHLLRRERNVEETVDT